jgi:hypothetical protein
MAYGKVVLIAGVWAWTLTELDRMSADHGNATGYAL